MIVTLPWPPRILSPNARTHWAAKAAAARRYRHQAGWLALAANHGRAWAAGPVSVRVTFHPPDKRGRDLDNMLAAIKSGLDGIADAIGVDDKRWEISIRRGDPVPGGAVIVELAGAVG